MQHFGVRYTEPHGNQQTLMTDMHETARRELRKWRIIAVFVLALVPCVLIAAAILVQLHGAGKSSSVSLSVPILALVFVLARLMSFECPDCGKPFSRHETRGLGRSARHGE